MPEVLTNMEVIVANYAVENERLSEAVVGYHKLTERQRKKIEAQNSLIKKYFHAWKGALAENVRLREAAQKVIECHEEDYEPSLGLVTHWSDTEIRSFQVIGDFERDKAIEELAAALEGSK